MVDGEIREQRLWEQRREGAGGSERDPYSGVREEEC